MVYCPMQIDKFVRKTEASRKPHWGSWTDCRVSAPSRANKVTVQPQASPARSDAPLCMHQASGRGFWDSPAWLASRRPWLLALQRTTFCFSCRLEARHRREALGGHRPGKTASQIPSQAGSGLQDCRGACFRVFWVSVSGVWGHSPLPRVRQEEKEEPECSQGVKRRKCQWWWKKRC